MSTNWPTSNLPDESQQWRRKIEEIVDTAARDGKIAATNSKAAQKGNTSLAGAIARANLDIADQQDQIAKSTRTPAAPIDPDVTTDAYFDEYGYPRATVYATVAQVEVDTAGDPISVTSYELFGRKNVAGESWVTVAEEPAPFEGDPQLKALGLPAGEDWAFKVRGVSDKGVPGEFSAEIGVLLAVDTVAPPRPSTPTGTSRLGQVIISWDGEDADGENQPADFSHADVMIATTTSGASFPFGKMEANGTWVAPEIPYGTTYYYSIVAVDFSGNRSEESARVAVTVTPLVDTDIIGRVLDGANIKLDSIQDEVIAAGAITEEKLSVDVTGKIDGAVADVAAAQAAADQAAIDAAAAGEAATEASTAATDALEAAGLAQATAADAQTAADDAWNAASVAVTSTVLEYATSSSATTAPTTGWSTTPPAYTPGAFIWQRTIVTYGSGSTTVTSPVLVTGNEGPAGADGAGIEIAGSVATYAALPTGLGPSDAGKGYLVQADGLLYIWSGTAFPTNGNGVAFKGDPGEPGAPGSPGAPGVSVSSVQVYYRTTVAGAAAPAAPTVTTPPAPWTATEPDYAANTDLWAVTRVGYSNSTFSYTPVSKVSSYTAAAQAITDAATAQTAADSAQADADAAQQQADALKAQGTDLITNGNAVLGSLNFSQFTLEQGDQPPGTAGAFYPGSTAANQVRFLDGFISIDPSKPILASMWAKQVNPGVVSRTYFGLEPYDIDGLRITPANYGEVNGTRTTLTAPLSAGQTTIQLTSAAAWPNTGAVRPIMIWGYTDSKGKTWPAGTYSRLTNYYSAGGVSGNTVTLYTPWAGPTIPAGTSVSIGITGGTYMYAPGIANVLVTNDWVKLNATAPFSGVHTNLAVPATTAFPIATTQAKVVILANYGVSGGVSKQLFAGLSLSEANAAQLNATQARAAADAAAAAAAAAQTAAGNAQTTANQAQATASGKSKTYRSTAAPSGSGTAIDDTWEQWDTLAVGGKLLSFWNWNGTAWIKGTLDETYLPQVNIGSGTYGQLVGSRLVALSVTADEIAANAIIADKIQANAVTAVKIAADAVTAVKIEAEAVTAVKIAAGAITTIKLDAEAVTADKVAANAITTVKLDAFAVTANKIAANTITANEIAANTITANELAVNSVTANEISANAIYAGAIQSNAVTADKIEAGAITAVKIGALAITADKIAANAITSTKIEANAINGKTITGALVRSSSAGARTELTNQGLRVLNSSNQELVKLGYGIGTGMEVRNPATGTLVPLAPAVFGFASVSRPDALSTAYAPNTAYGYNTFGGDTLSLSFTAPSSGGILSWGHTWMFNIGAFGIQSPTLYVQPVVNGSALFSGSYPVFAMDSPRGYSTTISDDWVCFPNSSSALVTTPGATYTVTLQWRLVTGAGSASTAFLRDRFISFQPTFN